MDVERRLGAVRMWTRQMYSNHSILRGKRACDVFYLASIASLILFWFAISIVIWYYYVPDGQAFKPIVQVLGVAIGIIGTVSGFIIFFGMLAYLFRYDQMRIATKIMWILYFLLTGSVGASAYFFIHYRRRECMLPRSFSPDAVNRDSPQMHLAVPNRPSVETMEGSSRPRNPIGFLQGRRAFDVFKTCACLALAIGALFGVSLPIYDLLFEAIPHVAVSVLLLGVCLGVVWVVSCAVMLVGMTAYLIRCDDAPIAHRAAWLVCFVLFTWVGPSIYFFVIHRRLKPTRKSYLGEVEV